MNEELKKFIFSLSRPHVVVIISSPEKAGCLKSHLMQVKGLQVFEIDGMKCGNTHSLFDEFACKMKFPSYFGKNWDALDECLSDLEWIDAPAYTILVSNGERVLEEEDEQEFQTFMDVLVRNAEDWASGRMDQSAIDHVKTPFHVIFSCNDKNCQKIRIKLANASIEYKTITL